MSIDSRQSWHLAPMAAVYMTAAGALGENFDIYVESLDGVCEPEHVLRLLKKWSLVDANAVAPIITRKESLATLLADEAYFPGYDTIWAVKQGRAPAPPDFCTWYAAEGEGHTPRHRTSPQPLPNWTPVAEWMDRNDVLFGLSQGVYCLYIDRLPG